MIIKPIKDLCQLLKQFSVQSASEIFLDFGKGFAYATGDSGFHAAILTPEELTVLKDNGANISKTLTNLWHVIFPLLKNS